MLILPDFTWKQATGVPHKEHPLPRTLQYDYTQGPVVVPGGEVAFDEQGTPVKGTFLPRYSGIT